MAYLRFPVPEYDFRPFKGLDWSPPALLGANAIEQHIADNAYGAYPVQADAALFDKFGVQGDHRHAVMCVTPASGAHLLGRSYAWWNQRALILDSLDAASATIVHDWRTPRPMNTRFGPEDGVDLAGGVCYVVACHMYDDHWLGNRTLIDNDMDGGFRVLGASKDDTNEFCEFNLTFTWDD
ncbi:MAG: hypothetical protein VW405_14025 [Rhodospirillaceae bacterium]